MPYDGHFVDTRTVKGNIAWTSEGDIVRIPDIEGRVFVREAGSHTYVYFVIERWYDSERHQTRSRQIIIGKFRREYPGFMIPNENYYAYFDEETGKLLETTRFPVTGINEVSEDADEPPALPEKQKQETPQGTRKSRNRKKPLREEAPPEAKEGEEAEQAAPAEEKDQEQQPLGLEEYIKEINEMAEAEARGETISEERRKRASIIPEELQGMMNQIVKTAEEKMQAINAAEEKEAKEEEKRKAEIARKEEEDRVKQAWREEQERKAEEERQVRAAYEAREAFNDQFDLLRDILQGQYVMMGKLARKSPETIISLYKAEKINTTLKKIQDMLGDSEIGEYLELVELPSEEKENGVTVRKGPSYSDVELLLSNYEKAMIWFRVHRIMGM